jgi:SEC-C motif-containing protein
VKPCYCGSEQLYGNCCQPYHLGLKRAENPEKLMRSRYSAYATANIDYIQATMRGKASQGFDPIEAKSWAQRVLWVKLQVLSAKQTSLTQGQVEFIASFMENKTLCEMREISDFLFTEGRWFYVDGKRLTS